MPGGSRTKLRSYVTYANVTATLALVVTLGGSSYAALVITGRNVKDGSLTGRDVKNHSLTGADIQPRSITASSIKGSTFRGPAGPPGAPGVGTLYSQITGTEREIAKATGVNGDTVTMTCPNGATAIGGGNAGVYRYVWLNQSYQVSPSQWRLRVTYYSDDIGSQDPYWRWTPVVVCASP